MVGCSSPGMSRLKLVGIGILISSTCTYSLERTSLRRSRAEPRKSQLHNARFQSHPTSCTETNTSKEVHYDLVIVNATLYPDGYAFSGNFFNGSYVGPTMEMMESDTLSVTVTNKGSVDQATHWHGITDKGVPYNDGAVGYSVGSMPVGTNYTYTFLAEPAGLSWYHGEIRVHAGDGRGMSWTVTVECARCHMEEVLQGGNRGLFVIKKRACDNPYHGQYDDEAYLALAEALPWFLNENKTQALRHCTAEEDRENFFLATNFDYEDVKTDAGQGPAEEMPWAGILVNGKGRAIPQNYSSEYMSGKSDAWGEPRGQYFEHRVKSGTTQRLRMMNAGGGWSFRMWIDDHSMDVISVSGSDVERVTVEGPYGLEMSPAERFDVLVNYNQTKEDGVYVMHLDSTDGCYKSVVFVVYDNATVTDDHIRMADEIQRNRTCDAECYTTEGCNYYKAFALDTNLTDLRSLESEAVPPENKNNRTVALVVREPDAPQFDLNGRLAPDLNPPLYKQKLEAHNRLGQIKNHNLTTFVEPYTFRAGEVADWCVVSYTPDRHPIHLHANRFWLLASGQGDLQDCLKVEVDTTQPHIRTDMFPIRYSDREVGQWIKFRAQIAEGGAFPLHCHLQYHIYKALGVPVVVGPDEDWPTPPADLPSGEYHGTGDGSSSIGGGQ